MKRMIALLLAAALMSAVLTGCGNNKKKDELAKPTVTETVLPEETENESVPTQTGNDEPVVVSNEERETAEDGTEYVTSFIESTYSDGTLIVESKSEILYTDGSKYCESQIDTYHADGSKTVELCTTQTDVQGSLTVLEQQTIEYDAAGQPVEESET